MAKRVKPDPARAESITRMLCTQAGREEFAAELEAMLFRDALDAQWPATCDRDGGGFLTDLDRYWRPAGEQKKSLEFQARQAWSYARAAGLYPGRGYDEAARRGFAFLTEKMWDSTHGGFFTLTDRQGAPLEHGRKHPHGHTYALQAFIALAPLIGEATARQWALRTFDWLENVAWDRVHGGYCGYFHRDNRAIRRDEMPEGQAMDWLGTPIGLKDLNVLGDALGALTPMAACNWDERAAVRQDWHFRHYLDRLIGLFEVMPYFYTADWTPVPDVPRSGQPLQLVAAFLEAASGTSRASDAFTAAKSLDDICKRFFKNKDGGYCFSRSISVWAVLGVELKIPVRSWWIQTEASRSGLLLSLLSPDDDEKRMDFARHWAFVERRLIDPTHHGFYETAEDGDKARRWTGHVHKTHMWKDVSHEAQFLMDAVGWLRNGPDFKLTS